MKKLMIVALIGAFWSIRSFAIVYTGGGTDRTDLSDAANWGGVVPTVSDVGEIDCAAHGFTFKATGGVQFKGLSFVNNGSRIELQESTGILTLGSEGLKLQGTGGLALALPVTLTAAQTWNVGKGSLQSSAIVSGTADWRIEGYSELSFKKAPGYGGAISAEGTCVTFEEGAQVCSALSVKGAVCFAFEGRVPLSSLFTGRSFVKTGWSDCTFMGTGTLVIGQDDTFDCSAANLTQFTRGAVEIENGLFKGGAATMMAGMGGTHGYNSEPVQVTVSGGQVTLKQLHVGAASRIDRCWIQNDGVLSAYSIHLGAPGVGVDGTERRLVKDEYLLSSGSVTDDNGAYDRGLVLGSGSNCGADAVTHLGIFTQTGGIATFENVRWGAQGGFWTSDQSPANPNGRSYGLLDLQGGVFNLPRTGFLFGPKWNAGSISNSTYDIKLRGATVVARDNTDVNVAMTVAPSVTPTEWNTAGYDEQISAPLDGEGVLRKTGEGRLLLTDATRFRGSLEVSEGLVEVRGTLEEPSSGVVGDDCVILTGDDLAKTLADGATVSEWSDSTGTFTAGQMTTEDVTSTNGFELPVLKKNDMNGHASVYFDAKHVLAFHRDGNPICGSTNYTIAVVFKPAAEGQGSEKDGNSYAGRMIIGNTHNWCNGANCMGLTLDIDRRLFYRARFNEGATNLGVNDIYAQGRCTVGDVSIALLSMQGNQMSICLNNVPTNNAFAAAAGKMCPRFTQTASGETQSLYIGTSDVDASSAGAIGARCYIGSIAEIRFYRHRTLSLAEQRTLMALLAKTYRGDSVCEKYEREADGAKAAALCDNRVAPMIKAPDVEWTPEYCDRTFSACAGAYAKPELVCEAWANGSSALRFDSTKQTVLDVAGNADPLSGQNRFSLAFVFRTTCDGTGEEVVREQVGLYSSMLKDYGDLHNLDSNSSGCANAAVTFVKDGGICAFHATADGGTWLNQRKPCHLNDGQPHVVVVAGSLVSGETYRIMVDGVCVEMGVTPPAGSIWPGYDSNRPHVIGAIRAGVGHFTGDLSGFKFWKSQLTVDEMRAVCEKAAFEYGFNLKERRAFTAQEIVARGLSATNVYVASGATFRVPLSATAPYDVNDGVLTGTGRFEGSFRFGESSTVDLENLPDIEDVQIDGAILKVGESVLTRPYVGGNVSSLAGVVKVDVSALANNLSMKARLPILSIDPGAVSKGVLFMVVGGDETMWAEYDERLRCLCLRRQLGAMLIIR